MSDGVDIVVTLHALATYAENANHWTDDKRMMDASGVADTIYEAMDRIEELEAELAEYKHVASAIDTQWALSQDEIADLKAELVKASEALECAKLYIESIARTTLAGLTGGKNE